MQLGRIGWWRWLVVAIPVVTGLTLTATGIIGADGFDEHFDAKQVVVHPVGDDGLRVREVVDIDFGLNERRGYQRDIPNDFGVPTDVTASSPDARDDLDIRQMIGNETRIRIGNPAITFTGQRRYILEYTLPEARLSSGELALDIIGTDEDLETRRFEVIVTGLELDPARCNVGSRGATGGCDLNRQAGDGAVFRTVIEPLRAGQGITVGGTITGRTTATAIPIPERPVEPDHRLPLSLGMLLVGLGGPIGAFAWSRRLGRNEVFAGGAADAAYGTLGPAVGAGAEQVAVEPAAATVLVPDDELDELATIEFVPPTGVRPWEGRALLGEQIDDDTVAAWFSEMIARDALRIDDSKPSTLMGLGPGWNDLETADRTYLRTLFAGRDSIRLGVYDEKLATLWSTLVRDQRERARTSGWWTRLPRAMRYRAMGPGGPVLMAMLVFTVTAVGFGIVALGQRGLDLLGTWWVALLLGAALPTATAVGAFWHLRGVRSATGSALALRTESFRRFLAASEGQHVDWAWKHGVLREYSAWAVALGEATAWNRALAETNLPDEVRHDLTTPLIVARLTSSFTASRTQPPSPSSGGGGGSHGGGFSSSRVGGGGGGGRSGSW